MTSKIVSESMKFSLGVDTVDLEWVAILKEKIDTLPNAEDFRDMHMICIENSADGHYLQEGYGITIAMNALRKDPKAKILLYGVLPMAYLRKQKPEIDIVLKHDNVRLMEIPFRFEDLGTVFQKSKELVAGGYTVSDEAGKYLGTIFHDLRYVPNWDSAEAYGNTKFQSIMEKVKDYFPGFTESTPEAIIEFLKSVSDARKEVMKGVKISGVYCDVEGTILVEGQLIQKVVTKLEGYEQQGKTITLWSDGNIDELKQKLEALGIAYPLKSKFDHAGAIAEIVIDDQDEYTFGARTKISAEKFICVSELV